MNRRSGRGRGRVPLTRGLAIAAIPVALSLGTPSRLYFSGAQPLVVTGTSFTPTSVVTVDGTSVPTAYDSSTQLTATLPAWVHWPYDSWAATRAITVVDAGGESSALSYGVTIPTWVAAWYRADQGITIATGVSAWTDLSGNSRHLAQATGSKQPTRLLTGYGGKPTVRFDGADDGMVSTSFALAQPYVWLLVAKQVASVNGRFLTGHGGGGNIAAVNQINSATASMGWLGWTAGGFPNGKALPVGVWGVIRTDFNGASSVQSMNNLTGVTANPGANAISAGISLGSSAGTGSYSNVEFAEALLCSSIPSAPELAQYKAYHDARYLGISDNTQTRNVVCKGDSITAGVGVIPYTEHVAVYLGQTYGGTLGAVLNKGIVGETASTMNTNYNTEIGAFYDGTKAKNVLVLMAGVNDLTTGATGAAIVASLTSIVTKAKATGYTVLVSTITAFDDANASHETQRVAANTSIRANAVGADAIIDLAGSGMDLLADASVTARYQGDKIHPTATGNATLYPYFAAAIAPYL